MRKFFPTETFLIIPVIVLNLKFPNIRQTPGFSPGLPNARPLGRAKLAKAPPPGLKRWTNAPQLPGSVGDKGLWNWLVMH